MSNRIALVIILAEDLRSARFLRKYVEHVSSGGEIRLRVTPSGAGDQWVRQQYPTEVREQRRRVHGHNRNAALVSHIDADTTSVNARHRQLADALKTSGQPSRQPDELVAIVVPKRHTETWLHGLCNVDVTERYDCKRDPEGVLGRNHDEMITPAARMLFELTRPNAADPPQNLPALKRTIPELQRLERRTGNVHPLDGA